MDRVLITGGAGFIGSNFLRALLESTDHGPEVLNVDCLTYAGLQENLKGVTGHPRYAFNRTDISDALAVERAMKAFQPDTIIHFAAESHVDRSIKAGDIFVKTNVLGTQVLLDAARRHDVMAFLHVSTDEVYGSIAEGSFREEARYNPGSPYAATKAGSDMLVLAHHNTYGIPATVTRCTNNFGPRQHPEKLLPKIIGLAANDQHLPIYGDGSNVRDWLYVDDHCRALQHVLSLRRWGEIFNIAGQAEKTNLEVVRLVLERLGKPESLIQFVADRPGHDWRYSIDDSKLRATGWSPDVSFKQGLDATISWVLSEVVA